MRTALDLRAVAALVVLCGSWGLNQVAIKVTLWGIPPALQMGARSTVAALLVFGWCVLRGKKLFRPDGSLWPGLAVGILFGLEFLAVFLGLQRTTASRAVIFIYLSPFVVALGGHFLLGETLGPRKLVGLACAFLGLLLAFSDGLFQPSNGTLAGDSLCVLAAVFWGATIVLIKGSVLSEVSAEKTLLYQLAASAVLGLALFALIGEHVDPRLAVAVLPAFLYQAVWVAAITYVAWFALIRDYPASLLASFIFLAPLFGVAFGAALLNEPVSSRLLAALVLVAVGIYLVNRGRTRAPTASEEAGADAAA
jgi:drug/metabolite transporter (DMT)-like permease